MGTKLRGSCSVWELHCEAATLCDSYIVWELNCEAATLYGSCIVCELHCVGAALCGSCIVQWLAHLPANSVVMCLNSFRGWGFF